MANSIPFNQPDKSLEITLQDGLDGLEDFTLQMACSATGEQFDILSISTTVNSENDQSDENNLSAKPTPFTLVTTSISSQPTTRRQRRT